MSQDPDPYRDAQEQNSQIEWIEPQLKYGFHFDFSFVNFPHGILRHGESTSPCAGD